MAKRAGSHSEMAHARQNDGLNVIFDQQSPGSSHSRSRSRSSGTSSRSSVSGRGHGTHSRRQRSSSSSSSTPASRFRSRSHPRCHRRSSRCRCDNHRRHGGGRNRRSPPHDCRSHSRSPGRSSHRRHYRSRSRSTSRWSRCRRPESHVRSRSSRYSSRTYRSRSRSRSTGRPVSLSLEDKRELLKAAKVNALKARGVEKLELPESVKPILPEQSTQSERLSPEPEISVRQGPEKTVPQSHEAEPDETSSPKMSPKRRMIAFSINNSVAKPTVAAPSCAKVTPRMDIYESRKPYGHWVPIKSRQTSSARKHTFTRSR